MSFLDTIAQLWQQFIYLFHKEEVEKLLPFKKIEEATNWRMGQGLWSGYLPPLTTRLYYLEISRTSYADKRELGIKPPPTHTFKLYYFSQADTATKQRISCFVLYENCYHPNTSEDYNAVEVLGTAIARHLELISVQSRVIKEEGKLIAKKGINNLSKVEIEGEKSFSTIMLLSRQSPETLSYWKNVIDVILIEFKNGLKEDVQRRR